MKKYFGFILIIIGFIVFYFIYKNAFLAYETSKTIPKKTPPALPVVSLSQNSIFYDRNNTPFYMPGSGEYRIYVKSNDIPQVVKDIFIETEDRNFYKHKGIDIVGIARALKVNTSSNELAQGGSTITQQLARNLYLSNEKSFKRKIKEIEISLQLEKQYSKDEILEQYINTIYFANRNYGIEAASEAYFGKSIKDLSIAQTAFICSIPNNPSLYDPLRHFNNTKKRQERILGILKEAGKITNQQYITAMKEKIKLTPGKKIQKFPDYYTYVDYELKQILSGEKGNFQTSKLTSAQQNKLRELKTTADKVNYLQNQGLKVYTSLNPGIQEVAVNSVYNGTASTNTEGSAVVVDNNTHEIVALVGGRDYQPFNFNRAFEDYRQPGSTIKPLLVYAPYFDYMGGTPDSIVSTDTICIKLENGSEHCPKNDSGKVYGNVTVRTAMKNSYNTAAINLFQQMTPSVGFSYLNKFHFQKIVRADHNLTAALGGFTHGMTPLEMTSAYSTFGNDGNYYETGAIRKITSKDGTVLYENNPSPTRVYSHQTNEYMRSMLNSVVKDGTARNINMPLDYIGGKTGTTNNNTNLWFVGLTSNYTIGTWIGNVKPNKPIPKTYQTPPPQIIWKNIVVDSGLR